MPHDAYMLLGTFGGFLLGAWVARGFKVPNVLALFKSKPKPQPMQGERMRMKL